MTLQRYLTVPALAEELDLHPETIRKWCRKYPGLAINPGGKNWRFPPKHAEAIRKGMPLDRIATA